MLNWTVRKSLYLCLISYNPDNLHRTEQKPYILSANSKLLIESHWWNHTTSVMTWPNYGTQECPLNLLRGVSPNQTHHVLHHCGIIGQCDFVVACEAKLLLRHP
ncbi:Os09g0545999 [Oryza sativa Japonica Group]|uniref:Os09g0545999 protein n=1 Tax=Oryza sativa subsp. japonica TaxID=39947 RepID=A0A0P0XPX0_ORYSJ|nr:hypothetical protein EE612_049299 [Oryza sativa]BAT09252.1 Os09g0545999 [Oryza sativa Japonica Group]